MSMKMTMAEFVGLEPCPFCGGEAFVRIDTYFVANQARYRVGCDVDSRCHGYFGYSKYYTTEAEAIAAWNERAEHRGEPPYDSLIRCLEKDWNISATWDGLRKFWCIELTEDGVKLRDAERGTLTAEQVREATYAHSIHADCADADWQAIADELNSRAERTCEIEHVKGGARYDVWRCSACGYEYAESVSEKGIVQNYCPNCGRRCI